MGDNNVNLPPGFRFHPADEELVVRFLHRKQVSFLPCHPDVIPDLDLYPYDPWELDGTNGDTYLEEDFDNPLLDFLVGEFKRCC